MRLGKDVRKGIFEAAKKAILTANVYSENVSVAVDNFYDWHSAWMSDALRNAWAVPEVREQLCTEDTWVDFGPLTGYRNRSAENRTVHFLQSFTDVFEPIIDQLNDGKKVREKQWDTSLCPPHVKQWLIAYYKYANDRDKALSEVSNALASCATTGSLVKKHPALEIYVPAATSNLPAVVSTGLSTFKQLTGG